MKNTLIALASSLVLASSGGCSIGKQVIDSYLGIQISNWFRGNQEQITGVMNGYLPEWLSDHQTTENQSIEEAIKEVIESSNYLNHTVTTYKVEGDESDEIREDIREGYGVVLPNGYYITANHVVFMDRIETPTPIGVYLIPFKEKVEEKTFLQNPRMGVFDELERIVSSVESDVAVFRIPENVRQDYTPLPLELGNSDNLFLGQEVYVVGNSFLWGFAVKKGIVSRLNGTPNLQYDLGVDPETVFMLDAGINPGDSGTVLIGEDMKVYGINSGTAMPSVMGWAIKINEFKPYLKGMKK